ncbi:hypothetical protein OE88DRAFT_1059265 [Heliocybe sulcata]|uniref:DUF6533 domain-containing protein n=1 Tax=Heliocybe sulcata TaxID=5364 RepID=A0A5C3MWY9_9AGAM|nr:hypothetical protein OE88DRAFT_1059265 [Heliocybe sulcata]
MSSGSDISAEIPGVVGTRYVTAAGLAVLLWDHVLTLDSELALIWRRELTFLRVAFIGLRYGVLASLLLAVQATSGFSSHLSDRLSELDKCDRGYQPRLGGLSKLCGHSTHLYPLGSQAANSQSLGGRICCMLWCLHVFRRAGC